MRKILSLITVITLFSPLANVVSSCSEKKLPYIPPYPIKETAIIIPDIKTKHAITLVKTYSSEKKVLDNQSIASKQAPIPFPIHGSEPILAKDWPRDNVSKTLKNVWQSLGGLSTDLFPLVKFKHVTIVPNQTVLCEMYLPLLGFTKENPRNFYIKGW